MQPAYMQGLEETGSLATSRYNKNRHKQERKKKKRKDASWCLAYFREAIELSETPRFHDTDDKQGDRGSPAKNQPRSAFESYEFKRTDLTTSDGHDQIDRCLAESEETKDEDDATSEQSCTFSVKGQQTISPEETNLLKVELEQTRQTIVELLESSVTESDAISSEKREEYMWDLWVITGILDHDISFADLESIKRSLIS